MPASSSSEHSRGVAHGVTDLADRVADHAADSPERVQSQSLVWRGELDAARAMITAALATADEAVCACEFTPLLGLSQATVSHHLKKLTDAGLLEREQRGKWAYFSIHPDAPARLGGVVRIPEVVR